MPLGNLPGNLRCLLGDLWRLAGDLRSLAEKPLSGLLPHLEELTSLRDLLLYVSGDCSLAEDLPFPAAGDLPFPAGDLPFPAGDLLFPAEDLPLPAGDLVCAGGDLLCLADEARALPDDLLRFLRELFGLPATSCADACSAGAACKEACCAGDQPHCLIGLACLASEACAAGAALVIAASASAAQV